MMKRTRKQYPSALKAKIVLEVLRETKTIAELAAEHQIHPNLITKWKQAAIADLPTLFERSTVADAKAEVLEAKVAELYQEIGKLTTLVKRIARWPPYDSALSERNRTGNPVSEAKTLIAWRGT